MKDWLKQQLLNLTIENKEAYSHLSMTQEALFVLAKHYQQPIPKIIVKENLVQAQQLTQQLKLLDPDLTIINIDHEESLRIEAIASSPELFRHRLRGLYQCLNQRVDFLITSAPSILRKMPSAEFLKSHQKTIIKHQTLSIEELEQYLIHVGYQKTTLVQQPLTYAKRGGLIDVFSIQYDDPIRIEFFDDIVDDLRFFNVDTQQTIKKIQSVQLFVANDLLITEAQQQEIEHKIRQGISSLLNNEIKNELRGLLEIDTNQFYQGIYDARFYRYFGLSQHKFGLLDYLPTKEIILSPLESVQRQVDLFVSETIDYLIEEAKEGQFIGYVDVLLDQYRVLKQSTFNFYQFQAPHSLESALNFHQIQNPHLAIEEHLNHISKIALTSPVVLCVSQHEIDRLIEALNKADLPYNMVTCQHLLPGINVDLFPIQNGFTLKNLSVYSSYELFDVVHKKSRYDVQFNQSLNLEGIAQLQIGDFVVHKQHGIGKYQGLITKEINHVHKDFLNIQYANDDVLLVPLEQFKLVRKYVSSQAVSVKLSKIGGSSWQKTKERIAGSVNQIADELIELYQARKQQKGFAFSADNSLQLQFEKEFPYPLTNDQVVAIAEMKQDMMSENPMDRLLCGDVGFGKTEVAIRGAFKAVIDQKQVAFLCPTTVLSQQHYRTFSLRFKNYPVKIALLNRFVEPSQQRKILSQLKQGQIDILIGTHRILSADVKYHDLGFLIIDEEQRFGVAQKEKIKKLKVNIDVLSLSATPIPRTLQMSLIGLRSLSQLNTAPSMRLPVMTHVVEKNERLIESIIEREIMRDGQVFYLYNQTSTIFQVAYKLQQRFQTAKVAVAHGKMAKEEIEDVMIAFNNNEIQILVCTTIVETGIDIPNANTMIVENAENFGLAQLYQIKGRVGRGDRLAYAYLLIQPKKQLTQVASKRLEAIKEFTQLGSGYQIAMRDLTIRGAGEILGGQQSGFIDAVGIDLYMELLQEAILIKQNQAVIKNEEVHLPIQADSYIPQEYLQNDALKIDLYQQIDKINSLQELADFGELTQDRYGKIDQSMRLLFEKKQMELFYRHQWIDDFKERPRDYSLKFSKSFSSQVDGVKLFTIVNQENSLIQLKYKDGKIEMKVPKSRKALSEMVTIIKRLNYAGG